MEKALILSSLVLNAILVRPYLTTLWAKRKGHYKKFLKSKLISYRLIADDRSHLIINRPVVYIANQMQTHYLTPQFDTTHIQPIPDTLIIKTGHYRFGQQNYAVTDEGLCRFLLVEKQHIQRIVYEKDCSRLLSSLAWMITHGDRDDHLSYNQLISKAKKSKLVLTCESSTRFAFHLLQELGIKTRIIATRTLDNWNTYDDGHYMLEVFNPDLQQWVIYDLDRDVCFKQGVRHLSLLDLIEEKNYQIHAISHDIKTALGHSHVAQYDLTFINEGNVGNLTHWYQRIMQFMFIEDNGENFSCQTPDSINYSQYPKGAFPKINFLSKNEFVSRFYAIK